MNKKTRITASILGTLLGMAGIINHGIFEILQGNNPTNGYFIEAIGEAHRYWIHGTEAAFTLIQNFLITGLCAVSNCGFSHQFSSLSEEKSLRNPLRSMNQPLWHIKTKKI